MVRKIGWVVLATLAAVFLACGHASTKMPAAPDVAPIALDAALGNKFLKAGTSTSMVARIGLAARPRNTTVRPPVNLVLLVDTSGSMEGKPIADARAASLAFVSSLAPEDRIAVVVFDSKTEVLLPSTKLADTDAGELRKKLGAMKASGTTDMASGLRMALYEVNKNLDHEGVNRIVLVGDGVPNDDRPINDLVAQASSRGVSITALGLGNDYDETLMGRMAQQSGGRFFYVEDSTKVASFFAEEVTRLHKVVARHATLELRPGPGVSVTGVVGRAFSGLDRGVSVQLGDLSVGEQAEVVVALVSSAPKDGANVEVLDAILRYEEGIGGAQREERAFVGAKSTQEASSLAEGRSKTVEDAFARAKDAAATLQKIEQQRIRENAQNRATPAAPTPAAARHPGAGAAKVSDERRMSPEEQRFEHDRALRNFQAY